MHDPDFESVKEAAENFLKDAGNPDADAITLIRRLRMICHLNELQMLERVREIPLLTLSQPSTAGFLCFPRNKSHPINHPRPE